MHTVHWRWRRCLYKAFLLMPCVISLWSKYDLNEIKLLLILLVDPLKASEIQQVTQSLGASRAEQTLCIFVWSTRQSWWCCMHYLKSLQLPESKHFNLQPLTTPSAGLKLLTSRVEERTEIFLSKRNSDVLHWAPHDLKGVFHLVIRR